MKDLTTINLEREFFTEIAIRGDGVKETERSHFSFDKMDSKDELAFVVAVNFDDSEWEHVCILPDGKCATYLEMSRLKETFFEKNEIAIQVHPKKSEYINIQKYTLHLWRSKFASKRVEKCLCQKIQYVYDEVKKYYKEGEKKDIVLEIAGFKVVAIFCGEQWLTWEEVCKIKQKYWNPEEAAIQFNISYDFDINPEHLIILWDAKEFDLPPKKLV